jgi:hypothetical protein
MEKHNKPTYKSYDFELLSKESVMKFLTILGYKFTEYNNDRYDDRYREWDTEISLCAVKPKEKSDPYKNEIDVVFRKEFEKTLLSLLMNAREIVYLANDNKSEDDTTL